MKIAEHSVVTINYTLKDHKGEVIDSSQGAEPLSYIHGTGHLIPGLESELIGKQAGESFKVEIAPEEAYGVRNEEMVQKVPKSQFQEQDKIEVGMQIQAEMGGNTIIFNVIGEEDQSYILDANHPLAGMTLFFDIEILNVRAASSDELAHGHVHGPEGHIH